MAEKILIVDDDVDTLRLVGYMLQRQGFQIVAANSGQQAISMAENEPPDLILLDVMMPEIDGYEVTRRLRANTTTADIPIIMFTAKGQVEDKVTGFEVGADDYLTKPTQPRELVAHIKAVLARTKRGKTPTGPLGERPEERGMIIGVLAVRGGLGVSTLALNLGVAIHEEMKKDVIVSDFRPGQGSIALDLGYLRAEGLNQLFQRKASDISSRDIGKEMFSHASGVRLLLSSHRPSDAKYASYGDHFEAITTQLSIMARYIVLDLGTALPPAIERVLKYCDQLVLVVEPVPQTLVQSKLMIDELFTLGFGEARLQIVLINRTRSGVQLSWSQVQDHLGRTISVIFTPAPELVYQSSVNNVPIIMQQPDSLTAQQFFKLVEKVTLKTG